MLLAFQDFWFTDAASDPTFLKSWYFWATHSCLQPMVDFARLLRRHEAGILRWIESRISNGILEGINSMIQAAKATARGYRSTRNLIAMSYFLAGKLHFRLQIASKISNSRAEESGPLGSGSVGRGRLDRHCGVVSIHGRGDRRHNYYGYDNSFERLSCESHQV
jgi:Transposase